MQFVGNATTFKNNNQFSSKATTIFGFQLKRPISQHLGKKNELAKKNTLNQTRSARRHRQTQKQ